MNRRSTDERLRALSLALVRLHRLLLDRERQAWEHRHGPVAAAQLLRLTLEAEEFAWLRPLSGLIAMIDAAVDAREPLLESDVDSLFSTAYRLLKSGEAGIFQAKYHDALQTSPEVVMALAEVSKILGER
jgi:hypothetical protein